MHGVSTHVLIDQLTLSGQYHTNCCYFSRKFSLAPKFSLANLEATVIFKKKPLSPWCKIKPKTTWSKGKHINHSATVAPVNI